MSGSQTNIPAEDKYEKCIFCGNQTDVLRETPIEERGYYIQGCCQLCLSCYRELTQTRDEMTGNEIEHLVKSIRL